MTAGLIVAVMLIPQSMAYAMLAGLPPQWGLYASILPPLVYALSGSSRQLSVGPVAIVCLMVAGIAGELAAPGSPEYLSAVVCLALMSGVILVLGGLLRFGIFANLLSHSVINGFINAAALMIAAGQLTHLLGLEAPDRGNLASLVSGIAAALGSWNAPTTFLGIGAMLMLLALRHPPEAVRRVFTTRMLSIVSRTGALAVMIGGAAVAWLLELEAGGVDTVGHIPRGLPHPALPAIPAEWPALLPGAALIALVTYLESISVARSLAVRKRQRVMPDRELFALGAANLAASASGVFPVAGGISRSGVNFTAGANTQLASVITAAAIAASTLMFSPLFQHAPRAILAAIVIMAVLSLVDFRPLLESWRYNRADAVSGAATFVLVLSTNVETGIAGGLAISLWLYLWRTMHPHIAVVGRLGEGEHYRNVLRYAVHTCPHVAAVRIDESLYFANAHALEDRVLALAAEQRALRHVVLVCSAVNFIDYSALESLRLTVERLRDADITLHLAEVKGPVMDRLAVAQFPAALGDGKIFLSTHEAMKALDCG